LRVISIDKTTEEAKEGVMEGPAKRPRRHSHTAALEKGRAGPLMSLGPMLDIAAAGMNQSWDMSSQLPPFSPGSNMSQDARTNKSLAPIYLGQPPDFRMNNVILPTRPVLTLAPQQNQTQEADARSRNRPRSVTVSTLRQPPRMMEDNIEDVAASLRSLSEDTRSPRYNGSRPPSQSFPPSVLPLKRPMGLWDKSDTQKCEKCGLTITPDKLMSYNGACFHSACFLCTACGDPLEASCIAIEDKLYCEKDYAKLMENRKDRDLPVDIKLSLTAQPARFQISNYNIHPPPALTADLPLEDNYTVYVHLCESQQKRIIAGGLQSGDVRVLRAGQTTIYFNGLKLNKMGPIKTEINFRNSRQLSTDFCIRFKLGNREFYSSAFKLVSSCSQLPQEIRDNVRPSKKVTTTTTAPNGQKSSRTGDSPPMSPSSPMSPTNNNNNISTNRINNVVESSIGVGGTTDVSLPELLIVQSGPEVVDSQLSNIPIFPSRPAEIDVYKIRSKFERCVNLGDVEGAVKYARQLAEVNRRN